VSDEQGDYLEEFYCANIPGVLQEVECLLEVYSEEEPDPSAYQGKVGVRRPPL
jgi:hypothetical protein